MSLKPYLNKNLIEAGIDEVGRGCLSGPVVAAAVVFPKGFKNELLNDSKKLTEKQRNELVPIIKEQALCWAISEVSEKKIDEINILQASFLAMHQSLDQLKIIPEHILVDGNKFIPYNNIDHTCVIKGDGKFLSIAAASILAKTYRDELMEQLHEEFPQYDWKNNKGYPTKKHREGIKIYGETKYHRLSFKLLPDEQLKLKL